MKRIVFLFSLMVLSGCRVGPDYYPPVTPMPISYSEDKQDQSAAVADEDLVHWWTLFNDPFLDELLEETIEGSFDYRIALEQVCQARAQYWVQAAAILPEIDFDAQASRYRASRSFKSALPAPGMTEVSSLQSFFQTGFDAIWQIDLFGGIRRSVDAAYDLWEAADEEARAVKIVVLSEVANTYATICAFQTKVEIASQMVELDEQLVELSQARFEAGLANEQEVLQAIALFEADKANLLLTQATLKLHIYSLATLVGREPESLIEDFACKRPIPYAVDRVPAGLPADLLRRRPDIRNAERNLAAATEEIGVAVAELFPKISLTGSSSSFAANPLQGANIGFSSDRLSKLFNNDGRIWGIGGLLTFPVLDFGKRMAGVDLQVSLREQAYLTYQKTVIGALQEVEQSLASYFSDEKRVQDITKEAKAYERTLELVADEFKAGLIDLTAVIQAKEVWLASMNTLTDNQQILTTDLIAVYKAMGGDW